MDKFLTLIFRGLRLRCPICGKGKLFRNIFRMNQYCPVCEYHFEREEGYFSSSMAINIVVSEFIVAGFTVPLAANPEIPALPILLGGLPLTILLPLLLFRHSRSLWMSMDLFLHPLRRQTD